MMRNRRRFLLLLLMILLLSTVCFKLPVQATGYIGLYYNSLSVWPKAHFGGVDYYAPGARLSLYKLADAVVSGENITYTLTSEFAGCGLDLSSVRVNEANVAQAKTIEKYIIDNPGIVGKVLTTKEENKGKGTFSGLEAGLYFVVQTGAEDIFKNKYEYINSFYVSVPIKSIDSKADEVWMYNVTVCPKLVSKPDKPNEPEKPDEPEDEGPTPTPEATPSPTPTQKPFVPVTKPNEKLEEIKEEIYFEEEYLVLMIEENGVLVKTNRKFIGPVELPENPQIGEIFSFEVVETEQEGTEGEEGAEGSEGETRVVTYYLEFTGTGWRLRFIVTNLGMGLPQTGIERMSIIILSVAGIAMLSAGLWLVFKKPAGKAEEDDA